MSNLIQYIIQEDPEEERRRQEERDKGSVLMSNKSTENKPEQAYKYSPNNLLENDFSPKSTEPKPTNLLLAGLKDKQAPNGTTSTKSSSSGLGLGSANQPSPSTQLAETNPPSHNASQNIQGKPSQSRQEYKLGTLSGLYESGHNPAAIGKDNSGGPSYGLYQIATYPGTMNKYLNFIKNNSQYREFSDILEKAGGNKAASQKAPNFVKAWEELSKNDNFNNSQYKFMIDTHLQPLLKSVQDKDLLDIDNRHPVVKDALYSLSVQHGKAAQIVNNTLQKIRHNGTSFDDATLLEVLYKTRADYVKSLPASQYPRDGKITQNEKDNIVNKRYPNELYEALKYLGL